MMRRGLSLGRVRRRGHEEAADIDMTAKTEADASASGTDTSNTDRAIVRTASDAIKSKLHAASAGYYDDPFIDHFARGAEGLTAASAGGSMSTPMPVHLEGQATSTTAAAAVGAQGAAGEAASR